MKRQPMGSGVILYEKEASDYLAEDLERSARLYAQTFSDHVAAQVPNLFSKWAEGIAYAAGARITDGRGNLFRVVQGHISQADWPLDTTPSLYTPLGVKADDPEAIPDWRQPTGAHDAYNTGDRVKFNEKIYESLIDGNAYSPEAYPVGWAEAT